MNTLITLFALGLGQPAPATELHCPAPLAALSDVKAGPPLVHTFNLAHNGTAGTLSITRIEASCGCLRRAISANVLQPGETARLTLEVNTLTQPDGPNRWQVIVGYAVDTPPHPDAPSARRTGELLLNVTANLSREVVVTPPQIGLSCTGEASQVLTITDRRAKPLNVLRTAGSSPHLTAEVGSPAAGPDGTRTQSITIRLAADTPVGHRDETLVLITDDPAYPEFRVPVRVHKRPADAVTVSPEAVAVRFAAGQEEVSALVQLRLTDGKPVRVASAESDLPSVGVKWSSGSGPVATVRVTVPATGQPGSCAVRVRFAEPAGREAVIPVSWTGGTRK